MDSHKFDIFYCFSRQDAEVVNAVSRRLKIGGYPSPIDIFDLSVGAELADEIVTRIQKAKVFLYFHSRNAAKSNWVKHELRFALDLECVIVPIVIDRFYDYGEFKPALGSIESLFYDTGKDSEEQLDGIVKYILNVLQKKPLGKDCYIPEHESLEAEKSYSSSKKSDVKRPFFRNLLQILKYVAVFILIYAVGLLLITSWEYGERTEFWGLCIGVILIVACLAAYYIGQYISSIKYSIKFCNTERKMTVKLFVDGKLQATLAPGQVEIISMSKGEYVISGECSEDKERFTSFTQQFDESHNNSIVSLAFESDDAAKPVQNSKPYTYRCFIGGSTSITAERDTARAVCGILYNQYEKYNFYITAHTFEDFKNKHKIEGQQYDYDQFIRLKADCAIFIICNHVGEMTLGEYLLAIETFEKSDAPKRPAIFVYNDVSGINGNEDDSVIKFRELVKSKNVYWRDYNGINELRYQIHQDIGAELLEAIVMRPLINSSLK